MLSCWLYGLSDPEVSVRTKVALRPRTPMETLPGSRPRWSSERKEHQTLRSLNHAMRRWYRRAPSSVTRRSSAMTAAAGNRRAGLDGRGSCGDVATASANNALTNGWLWRAASPVLPPSSRLHER